MGILLVDGQVFCFTLEDVARPDGVKIDDETAIPSGEYRVTIDHSTRFDRDMPHVLDVPYFEGIRIHPGNTDKNTSGCVLVGFNHGPDVIWDSKPAFDALFAKLKAAFDKQEQITLAVVNDPL